MSIQWNGVMPAVTTKFSDDDTLDLTNFEINIRAQVEAGVNGIILGGTLGEASTLLDDEKRNDKAFDEALKRLKKGKYVHFQLKWGFKKTEKGLVGEIEQIDMYLSDTEREFFKEREFIKERSGH